MPEPEPSQFKIFEWFLSAFRPFEVIAGAATMFVVVSWLLQLPPAVLYVLGTTAFICGSIGIAGHIKSAAERPTLKLGRLWDEHPAALPDQTMKADGTSEQIAQMRTRQGAIDAVTTREVEIGDLECHVWDEYANRPVLGATVIAQNERTGREYRGTTNRDGQLTLRVPCGYYAVTTYSEQHLWRTDAVRVASPKQKEVLRVTLQLTKSARWVFNHNTRKAAIQQLTSLVEQGSALAVDQITGNGNTQDMISDWQIRAKSVVRRLFGFDEKVDFIDDDSFENRLVGLKKLIERVESDIHKSMPWS